MTQLGHLHALDALNPRVVLDVLLQEMDGTFNDTRIVKDRNTILEKKQLNKRTNKKVRKHTESKTGRLVLYWGEKVESRREGFLTLAVNRWFIHCSVGVIRE
jgi:hypothetical protein